MAGNRRAIKQILEDLMASKVGRNAEYACLEDIELSPQQRSELTFDEVFAMNLINRALNGDMKASTEIMDRRYGKAQQHIVQEIKAVTYHTFLEDLAQKEQNGNISTDETFPQITIDITPVDGGSAEADLMSDLGI